MGQWRPLVEMFQVPIKNEWKSKDACAKISLEPDSNQWPKDYCETATVLRSTNWAIEGIDTK